ncbi:glycosyltransferase family 2 protein [Halobellus marinus]|uniref:glycosyltransferase family 2 protein n=1 Tax=Halobellus TaxID=1073986 RepID=UPI0028A9A9B8|nr:glycosyltransferase [Halobellus sp. DFY28]
MEQTPTVNVVIPYAPSITPEDLLNKALESVDGQNVETETIIVEDPERKGPAWARNQGLAQADRRYVAFLDADDLWKENKLQRQIERIRETGAGICVEGTPKSTNEFISGLLTGNIVSKTSSILIDTEQISVQFNESLDRFEDHIFMIESALESDVCLCENLVEIRKHKQGLSAHNNPRLLYQQRQKMASVLEQNEDIPPSKLREFRRILNYKACVQFRKENKFSNAALAIVRSLRYGLSPENIRAAAALPVFILLSLIKRNQGS